MAKFKELEKDFKDGKQLARESWNEQETRRTNYVTIGKDGKKVLRHVVSTMKQENNVYPYKLTTKDKAAKDWVVLNPDVVEETENIAVEENHKDEPKQ